MSSNPWLGIEAYNPAVHTSPAWLAVTCSRCDRVYQCTPATDFMEPADHLGWDKGRVCEPCLLALARASHAKEH